MNKPYSTILEYVWLILGLLMLGAAVHKTVQLGFSQSYPFFIFTFIAAAMYSIRRYWRKKRG